MDIYRWIRYRLFRRPYRLTKAVDFGHGPELIVCIHGIAAEGKDWTVLVKLLNPSQYHVVAYDLLGFGTSPKPKHLEYSADDHARAIVYSLRKDGLNQPIILIGHSMGCIISSRITTKFNLDVKRQILYQPPLLPGTSKEKRSLHASLYSFLIKRPSLVLTYSRMASKRLSSLLKFQLDAESWLAFERSMKNTILSQNTASELARSKTPTDIIYGRFDLWVSRTQAKNLIASNSSMMLHNLPEAHDISTRAGRYIKKILKAHSRFYVSSNLP